MQLPNLQYLDTLNKIYNLQDLPQNYKNNQQLLERGEFLVNLPESGVGSAGFVSRLPDYLWVTSYLYAPTNNANKLLSSFWVTCEFFF